MYWAAAKTLKREMQEAYLREGERNKRLGVAPLPPRLSEW